MVPAARTVVLGDLHLLRDTPTKVAADLADLVTAHPGVRIVFAGDLFDLAAVSPRRPPRESVASALGAHTRARAALGQHIDNGGEIWLVGGNHDSEVGTPGFSDYFVEALGASADARRRVRSSPWFMRDGGLHLEHGHLYDPDNAPAHPLVNGATSLGVHLTEQFVARVGAQRYVDANDQPPLRLFLAAIAWYKTKAPLVLAQFFRASVGALLKSGPFYRGSGEEDAGRAKANVFAEENDLPPELINGLLALGATPTLESLFATFERLYFDRVLSTMAIGSGLGALAWGSFFSGAGLAALGSLLLMASWSSGHDRYGGTVVERLAQSAEKIVATTDARLVVFGHTHRETQTANYANTGSFAFPRTPAGRPFLEIEGSPRYPRAVRRHWT
jgi:predicted phosphodiesterase